jgi:hypothetical protein
LLARSATTGARLRRLLRVSRVERIEHPIADVAIWTRA